MSDYNDEGSGSKFWRKSKENPFFPIAITGLIIACGYGAYNYKNRGRMSTSIYLMQLRVIAQGTVVGILTGSVIYTLSQRMVKMYSEKPSVSDK